VVAAKLAMRADAPARHVRTICEMCFWRCGVEAEVRGDRVSTLRGLPGHPLNDGRLCPRGLGGLGALYDPDRLRSPLRRIRERGADSFQASDWDSALGHAAFALDKVRRQYGPESIAGLAHGMSGAHVEHFVRSLGSPNVADPSYAECRGARDLGWTLTYGHEFFSPESSDMGNARLIVLLGYHLGENMHNTQVQDLTDAIRRGAKLVVADPRLSTVASKADWYLPLRPGTDIALLLSWIHILIRDGIYDQDYVTQHAIGFEELQNAVSDNTPEWAAALTEVPAALIEETARAMAQAKPAVCVHPGRHSAWYGDDVQRSRAVAILNALLGSYGREGGSYVPAAAKVAKFPVPDYPAPHRASVDGAGSTYPFASKKLMWSLIRATAEQRPYPIKAWVVSGCNPMQSIPNTAITQKAIAQLDFIMVADILPSEIAGWADLVLPECTYLERYDDLHAPNFRDPYVALRQPVVPPFFESRPNYDIFRELAVRMGLAAYYPWPSWEEYLDTRLRSVGSSLREMKEAGFKRLGDKPKGVEPGHEFATPSKKIELYSTRLAERQFDPVPRYTEHGRPPAGAFRLLQGRSPLHTFGRTVNYPSLGSVQSENALWLNPEAASRAGIKHGERVRMVNEDGVRSLPIVVRVTARIRPDCVYLVHGFGHTASGMRRAFNQGAATAGLLTRTKIEPMMGAIANNRTYVTLEVA
jgi:thiosulfate reductase / polysulfide reductase chain A